ncbi:hypothetical protein UFOVP223_34 [uncultured Caudovirales phage]|uniref:Uncharacterized protein n=1 Tax=uncultured Caudovirales phage TaxID=2100421 RepID=A0A6J5L556_9CAUD|nr:hypothetical protein UFOVP110_130 [uncultured Caudovirales phage]CAB5219165.1 hypothetical protein UFOVP223_34 [uncultured Caudovirales phage]
MNSRQHLGDGRPLHLGTIYVWDKVTDERFDKFKHDILQGLLKLVQETRDELEAEIEEEETVTEPLQKAKKRKEKMS